MYKIEKQTGIIHFPDGFTLSPPYEDARYLEYAEWVTEGNSPEEVDVLTLFAEIDVEVRPDQARNALDELGLMTEVMALINNPATPKWIRTKFEYTTVFRRNDPALLTMAELMKWDKAKLDLVFEVAKKYE